MQKKMVALFFASSLMLAACGDDVNTVDGEPVEETTTEKAEEKEKTADTKESEEVESEEKAEKDIGTRSNPLEIGESVEWRLGFYSDDMEDLEGLAKVTLNNVYKDEEAIDMLYFEEEALEDVEEGFTYAIADLMVELLEGDEDIPYTTRFNVSSVSEDGRKSPSGYTSLKDNYKENEYTDLYPGGSVDIKQAFLVPIDKEYLVEIEENISGNNFFENN